MSDPKDLLQRIATAGTRMDPGLSDRDVERLVAGAARKRRMRPLRRMGYATATCGALALAVLAFLPHPTVEPVAVSQPASTQSPLPDSLRVLRLLDGSTATALDSGTELSIDEETPDKARLSIARGRGRFDVTPRHTRPFVVSAGEVTITVLGTLFNVERVADRVGIAVESGTVRVEWPGGAAILQEGGSGWFPPLATSSNTKPQSVRERAKPHSSTKQIAHVSEAATAPIPAVVADAPPKAESAGDLLAAADTARMSGDAPHAAQLLKKLLRDHKNDPRAPLAAFTLGRILLMELSRPLDAASAFADARRLSPHGPLSEDSLAREVESLKQAGEPALAKARAQEYLRQYPNGRRAPSVRMMSGLK